MRDTLTLATLLAFGFGFTATTAYADTWAVIAVGIGESPTRAASIADTSAAALEATAPEGRTILQSAQLVHRVENEISLPSEAPPDALPEQITQAEDSLAGEIASDHFGVVISTTATLFGDIRPHLASLLRDDSLHRDLTNLCGYRIRAFLGTSDATAAAQTAGECFELIPRFELDRGSHPPDVLAIADAAGLALPHTLLVEGSRDDPPNCAIRVNGVAIGRTPSAQLSVPSGTYTVQVECDEQSGRIHRTQLEGNTTVSVRASLDRALRSRPLALVYASPNALSALPGDVASLGRAIGADHVLAAIEGPSTTLRSFRIPESGPAQLLGERTVEPSSDPSSVRESATLLARSTLGDPGTARDGDSSGVSPVGPILLGVGGAVLVAGIVVGAISVGMNGDISAECPGPVCRPGLQSQYDEMRSFSAAADALLVTGGVVAALGLVLTLTLTEDRDAPEVSASCGPDGCNATLRGSL